MASGFGEQSKKGKVNNERVAQHTFRKVLIGDSLVCLERAIKALSMKYEEVATILRGPMGNIEVPFVRHGLDSGDTIPFGAYRVEGLGRVQPHTGGSSGENRVPELTLNVSFEKGADETVWQKLIALVNEEVVNHVSFFRGHAVRITGGSHMVVPQYIDTTNDIPLFLNPEVLEEIDTNIYFPITGAKELKDAGISGYRGVLIHGKYGTGKSLIAYQSAKHSTDHKRTFVLCNIEMLDHAIAISRFLEPSTLFIEDLDGLSRDYAGLSRLRNLLSGVESKRGYDVMVIMTTNLISEVEKLDRSLLRPDRIDAIVEIPTPSIDTVAQIVKHYGGKWLAKGDFGPVFAQMVDLDCTPAVIIEAVKRSKIAAIRGKLKITPAILKINLMKLSRQIELSEPVKPRAESTADILAKSLNEVVRSGM